MNLNNEYKDVIFRLKSEKNFMMYLSLLQSLVDKYVIFIATSGTGAAQYLTPRHIAVMKKMGLSMEHSEYGYCPYVAIMVKGKKLYEETSRHKDKPLTFTMSLNGHTIFVYSASFDCKSNIGCGAYVLFDGVNFLHGCRGFNFLVFDSDSDEIVDTRGFDTLYFNSCACWNNPVQNALLQFAEKYGGGGEGMHNSYPSTPTKKQCRYNALGTVYLSTKIQRAPGRNTKQYQNKRIVVECWNNASHRQNACSMGRKTLSFL